MEKDTKNISSENIEDVSPTSLNLSTDDTVPHTEEGFTLKSLYKRPDNRSFFQEALDKYGYDGAIDPVKEKKLIRKIDYHILPVLAVCYIFYYVDKTTLSYAAIFGIKKPQPVGLNLVGTDYSLLSSAFYFGWAAWAIPSNLILQRSPVASYLSLNIFMWGVLLMAQAASHKFAELLVLRILSGAFEAIADPAFMFITSMMYTREEQPMRISLWYAANGLGVAGGGLLGFAIGNIKGALVSWRYEFLIIGAICSAWAFAILFLLPNSSANAWWLTRDERLMAVARMRKNQTGVENKTFKWYQVKETFLDIKTWLFFFLGLVANIPNGGLSNFSTLIIQGLGFNSLKTALLGIPQGALVVFWILSGAYINTRLPKNSRTIVAAAFMAPTIAGALGFLLAPIHANVGRLICFYLTGSYQCTFVLTLSLITSNTAGSTKKMLVTAMIWFGACIGNIISPFLYKTNQAPTYKLGIGSLLFANCLEVLIILALRFVFIRENKKKARQRAALAEEAEATGDLKAGPTENDTAFQDLTDKENINFVYTY